MPQKRRKFLPLIFKNSTTYFFLTMNLNHPKNSNVLINSHPKRVPPSAPALAEPTYPGGGGVCRKVKKIDDLKAE